MLPDAKRKCHHTCFARSCRELVVGEECQGRWVQIQGMNPQTGEQTSRWDCVDNLMPTLLLENTAQQRQTCAAVDKMRNESQQRGDAQRDTMLNALLALPEMHATRPLQVEDKRAS